MRKNIAAVIDAWLGRGVHQEKSCRTDGHTVWSYQTPIAHRDPDGTFYVIDTPISNTTSAQVAAILKSIPATAKVERPASITIEVQSTVVISTDRPRVMMQNGRR